MSKIDALVEHWREEDERTERIKETVDGFLQYVAKVMDKNYDKIIKSVNAGSSDWLKLLLQKYIKDNSELFEKSAKSGKEFMDKIL